MNTRTTLVLAALFLFAQACQNTEAPTDVDLTWDFSTPKKFNYEFTQISEGENTSHGPGGGATKNKARSTGSIVVDVQDTQYANLLMDNLSATMYHLDPLGNTVDSTTRTQPGMQLEKMSPNGVFDDARSQQDLLFAVLFPLPAGDLKKGDTEKKPIKLPFNAQTATMYLEGEHEMTFTDMTEVDGKSCARFESKFMVTEITVPEDVTTKYDCNYHGNSTFFFDLENRCFLSGDLDITIDFTITPSEEDSLQGLTGMSIFSTNDYHIERVGSIAAESGE